MGITATDLTAGTVITFTSDVTFISPFWTDLAVGTHLLVESLTPSGYHVRVLNTRTGRHDYVPIHEAWVLTRLRIIGTAPTTEED
jgi:hypothetical protein